MRRRLENWFGVLRRRPASWLALVGQFITLFGLPLPPVSAKDLSNPFPCQHHCCGCMNAADCWDHCCCFSARERVDWAKQHHTAVPSALVEEARHSTNAKHGDCCTVDRQHSSQHDGAPSGVTLTLMARQCRGEHALWAASEPAPVPQAFVQWAFDARPVAWCVGQALHACLLKHIPPDPPPRG